MPRQGVGISDALTSGRGVLDSIYDALARSRERTTSWLTVQQQLAVQESILHQAEVCGSRRVGCCYCRPQTHHAPRTLRVGLLALIQAAQ